MQVIIVLKKTPLYFVFLVFFLFIKLLTWMSRSIRSLWYLTKFWDVMQALRRKLSLCQELYKSIGWHLLVFSKHLEFKLIILIVTIELSKKKFPLWLEVLISYKKKKTIRIQIDEEEPSQIIRIHIV